MMHCSYEEITTGAITVVYFMNYDLGLIYIMFISGADTTKNGWLPAVPFRIAGYWQYCSSSGTAMSFLTIVFTCLATTHLNMLFENQRKTEGTI